MAACSPGWTVPADLVNKIDSIRDISILMSQKEIAEILSHLSRLEYGDDDNSSAPDPGSRRIRVCWRLRVRSGVFFRLKGETGRGRRRRLARHSAAKPGEPWCLQGKSLAAFASRHVPWLTVAQHT